MDVITNCVRSVIMILDRFLKAQLCALIVPGIGAKFCNQILVPLVNTNLLQSEQGRNLADSLQHFVLAFDHEKAAMD